MRPNDLPETTSASQLSTYAACPRKYAYRYVERRDPERHSPALALGSSVHTAIAWWFEARSRGEGPSLEDAARIVRADLGAALSAREYTWDKEAPAELEASADKLVRAFLDAHGSLRVIDSEVPFEMQIIDPDTGEHLRRTLIGYLDLELESGNFIELKTAKRSYSDNDVQVGLQFAAYRTLARYHGVDLELVALIRTKTAKVQHLLLPHDCAVSEWFMRAAAHIERAIEAGHFPPAPGMSCSACEYRRACLGSAAEPVHAKTAA